MSATNHTTNYNLPQFIGTDKPTWLTDVNGALNTIDTQMKANADSATSASTSATTANTNIGTLANLDTTAKTDAVSAINEVNTKAGNAQSTANTAVSDASNAQTTANSAVNEITSLKNYLNINSFTTYSNANNFTRISGNGNVGYTNLTVARNSDGTLCKIYGQVRVENASGYSQAKFKLTEDTGLRPETQISVNGCVQLIPQTSSFSPTGEGTITLNTDGTIEFEAYNNGANSYYFSFIACVIFVKNFGDTPSQN